MFFRICFNSLRLYRATYVLETYSKTSTTVFSNKPETILGRIEGMPARRGVKRQAAAVSGAENGGVPATNSRKGQNSKRNEVVDEEANNTELPAKRKRSARVVKDEEEYSKSETDKEETPKKGRRGKKPKAPIVYDIPPIRKTRDFRLEGPEERRAVRAHGFQGRLGYACLNTVLRNQDPPVFCSRNVRIKTIEEKGIESVKEMALQNVRDIVGGAWK